MQTFDQSIFGLYQQGFVTLEEALRWASNVDEFKLKVQGISTTSGHGARGDGPQGHRRRRPRSPDSEAEPVAGSKPSAYLDG
jgi:hypothetical protein